MTGLVTLPVTPKPAMAIRIGDPVLSRVRFRVGLQGGLIQSPQPTINAMDGGGCPPSLAKGPDDSAVEARTLNWVRFIT
jgi:hypothetical protein